MSFLSDERKKFLKLVVILTGYSLIYRNNSTSKDLQLCLRIQTEYDTFVLRSVEHIYKSRSLGAWQYLAILPFPDLCSHTIWKLYYALIVGFTDNVIENVEDGMHVQGYVPSNSLTFDHSPRFPQKSATVRPNGYVHQCTS